MDVGERVSWNLSEGLIRQLSNLLAQSNARYLAGNIEGAFYCLKVVRQRIIQSLKEDEREKCFELEKKFSNNSFSSINQKEQHNNFKMKQYLVYDKYNTLLMDYLENVLGWY